MIDKETREKIIQLWRDGETKAAIRRKTGVSQPTIRKIIKQAERASAGVSQHSIRRIIRESERGREGAIKTGDGSSNKLERRLDELERVFRRHERWWREVPTSDKFLINFTRNWPYASNPPLVCLRNGIMPFDVERMLLQILPSESVKFILEEIDRLGGPGEAFLGEGRVFEVYIDRTGNRISVQPFEDYQSTFMLPQIRR